MDFFAVIFIVSLVERGFYFLTSMVQNFLSNCSLLYMHSNDVNTIYWRGSLCIGYTVCILYYCMCILMM